MKTLSTAPKVQRFLKLYVYRCTNDTVAERRRRGCPCRGAPEAGCDLPLGLGSGVGLGDRAIGLGLGLGLVRVRTSGVRASGSDLVRPAVFP